MFAISNLSKQSTKIQTSATSKVAKNHFATETEGAKYLDEWPTSIGGINSIRTNPKAPQYLKKIANENFSNRLYVEVAKKRSKVQHNQLDLLVNIANIIN